MKVFLASALIASTQSVAVLTGSDCSALDATCPSTDCCGTARPDSTVGGNSATTNKEVCLPLATNAN